MIHVEKAIPMSHKIHGCRPPPQKHDREKKEFPKKGSFVRRLPIFVHNELSFRKFFANQRIHGNRGIVKSNHKPSSFLSCYFPSKSKKCQAHRVLVVGPYKSLETNVIPYEALERDPFQCYVLQLPRKPQTHTNILRGSLVPSSLWRKYYACLDISSVVVVGKKGGWSDFSDKFRYS